MPTQSRDARQPLSPMPDLPALQMLLSRHSQLPLTDPAPTDEHLALIFAAAACAPDHGRLHPWRFVLIRGDARAELGQTLIDLARAKAPGQSPEAYEIHRQKAYAAPMMIALGANVQARPGIPEVEQLLSVGAAAMNMLNAVHLLGYGGFWVTGPDAYDAALKDALDFDASTRMLGFLLVGTPVDKAAPTTRPAWTHFVQEWLGRPSI